MSYFIPPPPRFEGLAVGNGSNHILNLRAAESGRGVVGLGAAPRHGLSNTNLISLFFLKYEPASKPLHMSVK